MRNEISRGFAMRELSLFTGAGGGLLGTHLLGWEPIGYVEWDNYCQQIIRARIEDGILPEAPIFGDIQAFTREGYAESYTGMVDVITAGFPCQPFSQAGKMRGEDDPRNMWPATIECMRVVRPRFAFLENVPGLLSSGYFGTILGELVESGYDCRWRILSAAEMGASHRRDRLWIVAYATELQFRPESQTGIDGARCAGQADVSHSNSRRFQECAQFDGASKQDPSDRYSQWRYAGGFCDEMADANCQGLQRSRTIRGQQELTSTEPRCDGGKWWAVEPDVGRVVDGLAHRVDRLRAIGNGQVPAVVAAVWKLLTERIDK